MLNLSTEQILRYVQGVNLESFNNAYNIVVSLLESAMQDISKRNPFITNYDIKIANEALSGSAISASSLDFFVILDALQMETNYTHKKGRSFKLILSQFVDEFKRNFKLFGRKISNKKIEKIDKQFELEKNYNVETFYKDFNFQLLKKCNKATKIGVYGNKININNSNEIGINVNIYPVFKKSEEIYNMYNIKNGNVFEIDFKDRFYNVSLLYEKTNHMSQIQTRILNNIFYCVFNKVPNQIFIESLLFNVPENLFTTNIPETTVNIINFLKNSTMQNFYSICDKNTKIFSEPLNTIKPEIAFKFICSINIIQD